MSKKWWPMKSKTKADSHGTTLANEEIQFQKGPTNGQKDQAHKRLSEIQSKAQNKPVPSKQHGSAPNVQSKNNFKNMLPITTTKNDSKLKTAEQNNSHNTNLSNNFALQRPQSRGSVMNKNGQIMTDKENNNTKAKLSLSASADSALIKPQLVKTHGSPRGLRKLIKPGVPNAPQPSFKKQQVLPGKDVTIQDEYSDPFDALKDTSNDLTDQPPIADGYIEPYELFTGAKHANNAHNNSNCEHNQSSELYQDPWDNNKLQNHSNNNNLLHMPDKKQDYEDPWDKNTIPYNIAHRNDLHSDRKLHNYQMQPMTYASNVQDSWGSGGSSSSSSPPVNQKQRLKYVNQSPKFDHRLIMPKDNDPRFADNWTNSRLAKPVDKRLIKAEPSLEELRRMSPHGSRSAGTGSPLSSGHGSPMGTLSAPHSSENLTLQEQRRASTPYTTNNPEMAHHPFPLSKLAESKNKSRSLDIRNQQHNLAALRIAGGKNGINNFGKSASDDQLVGLQHPIYPLRDGGEYEEPWDKPNQDNTIAHVRSRSYELHHTQNMPHSKSYSTNRENGESMYDQPWGNKDFAQSGHLQSMQRFQQRRLELHPSEAFQPRDINTMLPLKHQSWYHGSISRDEALARLRNKPVGSYLVRVSESCKNNFTLSLQAPNGCVHMRMSKTRDKKWILGEYSKPFASVPEMLAHYARNKLEVDENIVISLQYPVTESML